MMDEKEETSIIVFDQFQTEFDQIHPSSFFPCLCGYFHIIFSFLIFFTTENTERNFFLFSLRVLCVLRGYFLFVSISEKLVIVIIYSSDFNNICSFSLLNVG